MLDMGAGDCRFAYGGSFDHYVGVEIDRKKIVATSVPPNGEIINGCVFRHADTNYDACIGNPPYARHHDIQADWKERTVERLRRELKVTLNKHCNLYIYFFCLGLLKTSQGGLVALLIPYEWVSRPSAASLREFILENHWNVAVYRFQKPIFKRVMTTASITIVDKAKTEGLWEYYDITADHKVIKRNGIANSRRGVLGYEKRGNIWALRGLSPGSQKIFTLTEGERVRIGLRKQDVLPCVTTLRDVPRGLRSLSQPAFQKHFVQAGRRCWLIRSFDDKLSCSLKAYLDSVPAKAHQTYTCRNQTPWFKYSPHPVPKILFSSGFTKFGPKVLINSVGAYAVGSVWGIHGEGELRVRCIQDYLLRENFEDRVVAHAKTLKKVEVRQLNAVLNAFVKQEPRNERKGP